MDTSNILILSSIFFTIAFLARFAGKGGGNFYVLTLVLFGVSLHKAVPLSQFSLFVSALIASIVFHRKKKLVWSLAFLIVPFALVGGFTAGFYSYLFSDTMLKKVFAVIMLLIGIMMFVFVNKKIPKSKLKKSIWFLNINFQNNSYPINIPLAVFSAFVSGFLASLVGLGGGIIMVPVLVFVFNLPMKAIIGITPILVFAVSFFGFLGHLTHMSLNYVLAFSLVISSFIGAYLGSHAAIKTNEKVLKIIFASSAVASGIIMWLKA